MVLRCGRNEDKLDFIWPWYSSFFFFQQKRPSKEPWNILSGIKVPRNCLLQQSTLTSTRHFPHHNCHSLLFLGTFSVKPWRWQLGKIPKISSLWNTQTSTSGTNIYTQTHINPLSSAILMLTLNFQQVVFTMSTCLNTLNCCNMTGGTKFTRVPFYSVKPSRHRGPSTVT